MKFKIQVLISLVFIIAISCNQQNTNIRIDTKTSILSSQDSVKQEYYLSMAFRQNLFSQGRQIYLDSALQINPNRAYLWQQKAMPLFKSKKYEVGMVFIDKAVQLDPDSYLDYRAFIKCIFSKQYNEAIVDFQKAKELFGDSYVMDHTYDFYLGLCYLQLNEFEKANSFFKKSVEKELIQFSEDVITPIDWFYLGISEFELEHYNKAIIAFDKLLIVYPTFSDAQYFKVKCLVRIDKLSEAKQLLKLARENNKNGNTINEANSIYEYYPYQVYDAQFEFFRD